MTEWQMKIAYERKSGQGWDAATPFERELWEAAWIAARAPAASPTAPAQSCGERTALSDALFYGVGFERRHADGSVEHIPVEQVITQQSAAEQADEAVTADAARYQWLRTQHEGVDTFEDADGFTVSEPTPHAFTVFKPGRDCCLEPVGCMPGELDRAIDAARAKDSK